MAGKTQTLERFHAQVTESLTQRGLSDGTPATGQERAVPWQVSAGAARACSVGSSASSARAHPPPCAPGLSSRRPRRRSSAPWPPSSPLLPSTPVAAKEVGGPCWLGPGAPACLHIRTTWGSCQSPKLRAMGSNSRAGCAFGTNTTTATRGPAGASWLPPLRHIQPRRIGLWVRPGQSVYKDSWVTNMCRQGKSPVGKRIRVYEG